MSKYLLFFIISLHSIIVSCNKKVDSNQNVVSELIRKYPELGKDTIENYRLIRTVIIGNRKIGIKLYSAKLKYLESHQIIVLNNDVGETYAIPLFSNNVRKYWNFENESKNFKNNSYNSLFELEFMIAINHLKLNDTHGTGYSIMYEMIHSLLHFQQLTENDNGKLECWKDHIISSDSNSDTESEFVSRNKTNCNQILKGIVKDENVFHYNAHFDIANNRVFQFEFPTPFNKKINQLNIKIYRLGREIPLILL